MHIRLTMCLRNTPGKDSVGWYTLGTDIAMHLRQFLLITYIYGSRIDINMIEYTIYQVVDQKHHDVLQLARNSKIIICYDNELEFIYLLRE